MFKNSVILFSVCLLAVGYLTGCHAKEIFSTDFEQVFGQPHIKQGNTYYYLQPLLLFATLATRFNCYETYFQRWQVAKIRN